MNRGDIYWACLDPTQGSEINKIRPCVIVGATAINKARRTVMVVPLSSLAKARPPLTIAINCMKKSATAVCDQIRAIDKSRLRKRVGNLTAKELNNLDDGLRRILSL